MLTANRLVDSILQSGSGRGATVALIGGDHGVTYHELARRVVERGDWFDLDDRSVVVLTGDRSIEYVITYLALLDRGHVPLLVGDHARELALRWDAAALVEAGAATLEIDRRNHVPAVVHPDLALLMSTSGSTGSPKLVRLSHTNLTSNASAIADYLDLDVRDRGISTLPFHYCYGLSVLHSHLVVGASVVTSEASVVDPCFRDALERHEVTNVAGVPHTFDLLERVGPDHLFVPSLRFLTQAGGRLAPGDVGRWIDRSAAHGVDFYVMYGQTEATARMAYLRPEDGARHPGSIGRAIPGGSFSLRSVDGRDDGAGELVYRGPNVMLGYAERADHLALGRTIDELATGDIAKYDPESDLYEIVGRRSRFVKPFGVRIDLDGVEAWLRERLGPGTELAIGGDDERLGVIVSDADPGHVAALVRSHTKLPAGAVVVDVGPVPRTASGKVDYDAVAHRRTEDTVSAKEATATAIFAAVFERAEIRPEATFVSLGGDSLSYIECSLRLESALGRMPADWHLTPVGELDRLTRKRHRWLALVDTTVILRAVAICTVVATHMRIRYVPGGAHILLAVAGFNLARFAMPIESTAERVRAGLRTVARVAVPTVIWAWCGLLLGASYGIGTVFLVNNYVGPSGHRGDHWHFWFIEVFVHLMVVATLLLAIPAVRRTERRFPYAFPLALFAGTMLLRMEWAWLDDWYNFRFRTHSVAFFFMLGWLIQRSDSTIKRLLTTVLCLTSITNFFEYLPRERFIGVCLVTLLWCRELPLPRLVVRPIATLASASMWILISHFTIWPVLAEHLPRRWAYVATLAAGVVVWLVAERLIDLVGALARAVVANRPIRRRRPALVVGTIANT